MLQIEKWELNGCSGHIWISCQGCCVIAQAERADPCPVQYVDEPLAVIESWLMQDAREHSGKVILSKTAIQGDILCVL